MQLRTAARRFAVRAAVTAVVAAAVVVGTAQMASANAPAPIKNPNSGMCMQPLPLNGGTIYDNGIPIWQVPCNGSPEQNWSRIFLSSGANNCGFPWFFGRCGFDPIDNIYYVVNQLTGSCMDVTNANSANHTPIQQWECNNGGSEKWWLPSPNVAQGSISTFTNYRTNKCLDVPSQTTVQSPMQEYSCFDGMDNAAQIFTIP
jgi:hypothetical protein